MLQTLLDALFVLALLVGGTLALYLAALACLHGGAFLEWLLERFIYGREQD